MPRPLNESETLEFLHDYGRLTIPLSPSGAGGVVVLWESHGIPVLVYQADNGIQYGNDISDLSPTQIANLGIPALAHGMLYYLPAAIIEAIGDLPTNIANEAIWVADKIGQVAAAATKPILPLTPILIGVAVILALIYLPKGAH